MGKLVLCIPACPLCASVPLCIQNELQLIKNKPGGKICIRFQSVGEKNVISPQENIKETFEIEVSDYELFFKDDEEDLLIEDEASLEGILTLLGE